MFLLLFSLSLTALEAKPIDHTVFELDGRVVHLLYVNRDEASVELALAKSPFSGVEKTSQLVEEQGGVAGINGGFFRGGALLGAPSGILVYDGEQITSTDRSRGAIGWDEDFSNVLIDRLDSHMRLVCDEVEYDLDGLNIPRKKGARVYYTEGCGDYSLNTIDGNEYLLDEEGEIRTSAYTRGTPIGEDDLVISTDFGDDLPTGESIALEVELLPQFHPENQETWESFPYILGTTPVLIVDGAIVDSFLPEKTRSDFLVKRHPRSAIGLLFDGTPLFVMVDSTGGGMTMNELAELMSDLGCQYAINLDGGGSSTLVVENAIYYNDRKVGEDMIGDMLYGERKVGNAFVIVEKGGTLS